MFETKNYLILTNMEIKECQIVTRSLTILMILFKSFQKKLLKSLSSKLFFNFSNFSFIILKKISKNNNEDFYFLKKSTSRRTYLSICQIFENYLLQLNT